jgi:hypothetical protein
MAESKQEKKAGGATASPTSSDAPHRQLEEAYGGYANSLQDAWLSVQTRLGEEQRNYLQSVQTAQLDVQKELQDAHQRYVKAHEAAAGKDNAAELCAQAHREYVEAVNAAHVSGRNKLEEIERYHRDKLESLREEYSKKVETSHRSLVKGVQKVWSRVDPDRIDAQQLNQLSHALLAVPPKPAA